MKQKFTVTLEGATPGPGLARELVAAIEAWRPRWTATAVPQGEPEGEAVHAGPLVSILLPTYNYAHRIEKMIASIRAQLVKDVELIVVDDGSTDDTIVRVRPLLGPGDRLILHGKNRGAAAAINTASRTATGLFMTWVSADNEMDPKWLEILLGVLSDPAVGVAYANYDRFSGACYDPATQDSRAWGKPYDPSRLINDQNCFVGPAFLVRAEIWRETGELRGKNSCDYDHWLRIEETCMRQGVSFVYHPAILCHYYGGDERATVARRQDYDANVWQAEARKRRGIETAAAVS
jgi:glycosyltransferase involved in cell wall biosynthesis